MGASNLVYKHKRYADVAEYKFKGRTYILAKPMTYMNLSGKAVNYWLQNAKLGVDKMLVVTDDLALPFGTIRIKAKGSAGGHNGLEHIIETLGHSNFARLRFGIGSEFGKGQQVDYVLGKWNPYELMFLPDRIKKASEAVKSFGTIGLNRTMNFSNEKFDLGKKIAEKKESEPKSDKNEQ